MAELHDRQPRPENELRLFGWTVVFHLGGVCAQWGEQTEEDFQEDVKRQLLLGAEP